MADFGSPIAQNVDVSPEKGFETIGSLIGLQSKQLALQGQAADVQQKQQDAQQRAAMAKVDWLKYQGQDGTLDVNSVSSDPALRKAAGDFYPDVLEKAAKIKSAQVLAKQSLLGLNSDTVGKFASTAAGVANDPDVIADNPAGRQKVTNAFNEYAQTYGPDAQHIVSIYGPTVQHAPQGKLAGALQSLQLQSMDAKTQIDETKPSTGTIDTGSKIQPVSIASSLSSTPGAVTKQGGALTKTLAPTEQLGYKQAAAAATATGAARATGVAGSDVDRANQVSANIKAAPAGIQTTQQIDDLADQIHSGKWAAWVSKAAAASGINESTYARQLLEKDLGIIKTQMTSAAPSDSRAATILSGTPDATSDPQTIHGAMDYVRGSFRQNLAQGKNLEAYRAKHPDLSGFQDADDHLTGTAGPLIHEFLALKGKDQQAGFYKRNFSNAQDALKFRNQAYAASHTVGLDNANDR